MPRALWRRRRTYDLPRPAGRRWAGRLYRGRVLARQMLRVPHRRRGSVGLAAVDPRITEIYPHSSRRIWAVRYRPAPSSRPGLEIAVPAPRETAVSEAPPPDQLALTTPVPAQTTPADGTASLLPGDQTLVRRLCFLLVSACTLASLSLGVLAILLAMRGDVRTAAICLVGCVLLDGVDGLLARRLRVASPFGAQMDSLADMCAFGLAAPVVVYASVAGTAPAAAAAVACALAAACAAIRLARFNVSPKDSRFFTGLPTTLAAGVLALVILVELPLSPTVLLIGVSVLAFAMVSSFPYATVARLLRLPPWLWLAPLAGSLVDPRLTLLTLIVAYLASGPVLWIRHRRAAL